MLPHQNIQRISGKYFEYSMNVMNIQRDFKMIAGDERINLVFFEDHPGLEFHYLCNDFRIHGSVVIKALWPSCSHVLPDMGAIYSVLQRGMPTERIEAPMAADGACIRDWYIFRKALAHNGLWGRTRTSYSSRWCGFPQWAG